MPEGKLTAAQARVIEAAKMARTRLQNFADDANAGNAQAGGRELSRKVWAAFAEFDEALAALALTEQKALTDN